MPKRGGIIGRLPKFHDFQLGVYSCGSFRVQRCPNVQVTWYPFPSIYPSFLVWAPSTSAISRATDGFSAMQTIIFFSSCFYTNSLQSYTIISHWPHEEGKNREHTVAISHIRLHKWFILNFPAFPSFVGTDIHYIRTDMIIGKFPFRVFGIAFHLLHMFRQRFG